MAKNDNRRLVHNLGDGQCICEEHWPKAFPNTDIPTYGWEPGECNWCEGEIKTGGLK